ncbi:MAG: ABC transporter permease [Coleofasciculus sp. Co-bin14]|nr:ABC transporter permease [Coleofasciculus sp. Co-bin14]
MASIARKNLLEDIPRFLVAQAGIMFAVGLVTIQTGLQYGFARSSSLLIDKSKADIWVSSKNMVHLGLTLPIPYERVSQAQNVAGVDRAEAFIVRGQLWRDPEDNIASATLIGLEPEGQLFSLWNITQGRLSDLKQPYSIIVDEASLTGLNVKRVGDSGKLNHLNAKVVGLTKETKSLVLGSSIFTSLESANTYLNPLLNKEPSDKSQPTPDPKPLSSTDPISFVLVRAKPGENLQSLKQRLEAALPDTRADTRDEMALQTQRYWQQRSGIGFILGLGAVVGLIVGVVIVGQILYSSVSDHIKEFGTLKAMGASDWAIYKVIIEQAMWMAILGYVPGMALCLGVAAWTSATQGILILITPGSAAAVFGITVVMCITSAIFAIQKVTRVDPAIVFKA